MISNEDPTGNKKAYKQMLYCNIFNTILPVAMSLPNISMIHPIVLPFFMIY